MGTLKTFFVCFDLLMLAVMLLFGVIFKRSKGNAASLIAGFNSKNDDEKAKYDLTKLCRCYGNVMLLLAAAFALGVAIDFFTVWIGCALSWVLFVVVFIVHAMRVRNFEVFLNTGR